MKKLLLIVTCLLLYPLFADDIFYAEIYAVDNPEKIIYTHTNTVIQKGDSTIIDHFYHTPDGKEHAQDRAILVNNKPIYNLLSFHEIGEYSTFIKNGDKAILKFETVDDKKEASKEIPHPLVLTPTQQIAFKENLDNFLKGETVNFYLFAPEIVRFIKMRIFPIEHSEYQQENCMVLQVKATNALINLFLGDIFYVVDKDNGRIMEAHGFSTLRLKVDGEWRSPDMDIYYTYE
ncbi:MAG: hypothetical protein WCT23_01255 [Candidatus Neomarinimicrobiota bacterium]